MTPFLQLTNPSALAEAVNAISRNAGQSPDAKNPAPSGPRFSTLLVSEPAENSGFSIPGPALKSPDFTSRLQIEFPPQQVGEKGEGTDNIVGENLKPGQQVPDAKQIQIEKTSPLIAPNSVLSTFIKPDSWRNRIPSIPVSDENAGRSVDGPAGLQAKLGSEIWNNKVSVSAVMADRGHHVLAEMQNGKPSARTASDVPMNPQSDVAKAGEAAKAFSQNTDKATIQSERPIAFDDKERMPSVSQGNVSDASLKPTVESRISSSPHDENLAKNSVSSKGPDTLETDNPDVKEGAIAESKYHQRAFPIGAAPFEIVKQFQSTKNESVRIGEKPIEEALKNTQIGSTKFQVSTYTATAPSSMNTALGSRLENPDLNIAGRGVAVNEMVKPAAPEITNKFTSTQVEIVPIDAKAAQRLPLRSPPIATQATQITNTIASPANENIATQFDGERLANLGGFAGTPLSEIEPSSRSMPVAAQTSSHANPALAKSVAVQIARSISPGSDTVVEITLDPIELGKIRMTLQPSETGINVQILGERSEIIELMRRNASHLEAEFEVLGYDDINFDFFHDGQNDEFHAPDELAGQNDDDFERGDNLQPGGPRDLRNGNQSQMTSQDALDLRL
jgi:hypothetical protein